VRQGSEAVDVIRGQLVGRRLKDVAVVMVLHELAPGDPGGVVRAGLLTRFATAFRGVLERILANCSDALANQTG